MSSSLDLRRWGLGLVLVGWLGAFAVTPAHAGPRERAEKLFHSATAAYQLDGDLGRLVEHYSKVQRIDPTFPDPYYNLGLLHEEAGDWSRAREAYRAYLDLADDDAPFAPLAAAKVQLIDDIILAADDASGVFEHELAAARGALADGALEEAFVRADRARGAAPGRHEPYLVLAIAHRRAGDLVAARDALTTAIGKAPAPVARDLRALRDELDTRIAVDDLVRRGDEALAAGRPAEAARAFAEAHERGPSPNLRLRQAAALAMAEKRIEARTLLLGLVDHPDAGVAQRAQAQLVELDALAAANGAGVPASAGASASAQLSRAERASESGDWGRVVSEATAGLDGFEAGDSVPELYALRAEAHRQRDDRQRAKADATIALALDPTNPLAHAVLGRVALVEDDNPSATAHLFRALQDPDAGPPGAWFDYGRALYNTDNLDKAREAFDAAAVEEPDRAKVYEWRGTVRKRLGDRAGAEADFRRAIRLDPDNNYARQQLDKLLAGDDEPVVGPVGGAGKWFVALTRQSGGKQTFVVDNELPRSEIKARWDEGDRMVGIDGHEGRWAVVMAANTGLTDQAYEVSSVVPRAWIQERMDRDYRITSVTHDGSRYFVLMSTKTGISTQQYTTSSSFPKDWIEARWGEGYRVNQMVHTDNEWFVVMSKDLPMGHQWYKRWATFPEAFVTANYGKGRVVTEIERADGEWFVIMSDLTGITDQKWLLESSYPSSQIADHERQGYRVTLVRRLDD